MLMIERNPAEVQAAVGYGATSYNRLAVHAAQIEVDTLWSGHGTQRKCGTAQFCAPQYIYWRIDCTSQRITA